MMLPRISLSALILASAITAPTFATAQTSFNWPPNAPTLLAPANNTKIAMPSLKATIDLSWRDNGDPDGDRVSFYVETYYYDVYTRSWKPAVVQTVTSTRCPMQFNGSPGSNVHLAWRVYAMDATKRSRPWYSVTGWSSFQVTFPASTTPQQPPSTTPQQTASFYGTAWNVWGHHAGSGTWRRYQNSTNVFQADWKKGNDTYRTNVTLERKGNMVVAISRTADGKFHTRFNIYLDENPAVGERLTSIPRNKRMGAGQSKYETTGDNADVAHATLIQ